MGRRQGRLGLINDVANPALEGSFEVNGVKVTTAWSLFKEHMAECTPEWAEGITEVSADTIVELARMYSQDTPSTIYAGYHLYDNCEEMGMTWACLAALRAISASAAPLSGIWGRASRRSTWPASPSRRDSRAFTTSCRGFICPRSWKRAS